MGWHALKFLVSAADMRGLSQLYPECLPSERASGYYGFSSNGGDRSA